jgi:hypothetical protein
VRFHSRGGSRASYLFNTCPCPGSGRVSIATTGQGSKAPRLLHVPNSTRDPPSADGFACVNRSSSFPNRDQKSGQRILAPDRVRTRRHTVASSLVDSPSPSHFSRRLCSFPRATDKTCSRWSNVAAKSRALWSVSDPMKSASTFRATHASSARPRLTRWRGGPAIAGRGIKSKRPPTIESPGVVGLVSRQDGQGLIVAMLVEPPILVDTFHRQKPVPIAEI